MFSKAARSAAIYFKSFRRDSMPAFECYLVDELEPIFTDSTGAEVGLTEPVTLNTPRRSYAGVNLLLPDVAADATFNIEAVGTSFPATATTCYRMIDVPVEINTGASGRTEAYNYPSNYNADVIKRVRYEGVYEEYPPFYVFEVLETHSGENVTGATSVALAVQTEIPAGQAPGDYTLTLNVTVNGATETKSVTITVHTATVPPVGEDSFKYDNPYNYTNGLDDTGFDQWSPDAYEVHGRYAELSVKGRINIYGAQTKKEPEWRNEWEGAGVYYARLGLVAQKSTLNAASLTNDGGKCKFTFATPHYKHLGTDTVDGAPVKLNDTALIYSTAETDADVIGTHTITSITGTYPASLAFTTDRDYAAESGTLSMSVLITKDSGDHVQSTAGQANMDATLVNLRAFVDTAGISQSSILTGVCDEPGATNCGDYRFVADVIKEAAHLPGVKILNAAGYPARYKLAGAIDIWCPTTKAYEIDKSYYDTRVSDYGEECWTYTAWSPGGKYCNRMLDMERLRCTYLGWGASLYNLTGYLHWTLNYHEDPYSVSAMPPHFNAGDQGIVYYGRASSSLAGFPMSSQRHEAQRIGIEDYELLKILKESNTAAASAIIAQVFRDYQDYEKDVTVYRASKASLLSAVSSLQDATAQPYRRAPFHLVPRKYRR